MVASAALVRGDGIGPEIIAATVEVMTAAGAEVEWIEAPAGEDAYRETGEAVPESTAEAVRSAGVALKGPIGVPMTGYQSPNQTLRRVVGAYANARSARYYKHRGHARYPGLDLTIVRDQTEDLTRGAAQGTAGGEAGVRLKVITRASAERVARFTYRLAQARGVDRVTIAHLAPSQRETDGLFLDSAMTVADEFPGLAVTEEAVDPLCVHLLQDPSPYRIVLTTNVYGGILCGVLAGLAGTVGVMPGGIFGDGGALFEAGHGNAPKYAGHDRANPVGCILSGAMLLDHIGQSEAADRIRVAVEDTITEGRATTPDLGGTAGTAEFARRCAALLR